MNGTRSRENRLPARVTTTRESEQAATDAPASRAMDGVIIVNASRIVEHREAQNVGGERDEMVARNRREKTQEMTPGQRLMPCFKGIRRAAAW